MISVCMPYHERRDLLEQSIRAYETHYDDLELSICDDRSRPSLVIPETRFDVAFSRIESTDHSAKNPCVPMNRAVNQSKHDVIVITNPEIEHREPVFGAMLERLVNWNDYVIAACWNETYWIAHSTAHQYTGGREPMPAGSGFHFCAMLTRQLWETAGGFDEDYREGQGCDDNDWLWRLDDVGANFVLCDDLVVHHYKTHESWPTAGLSRNRDLLHEKWAHKWNPS